MHMLQIDGRIKPGRKEEFFSVWSSQILPVLKQQHGFIDEMLLFDDTATGALGLSFWETRADAEQYLRNMFDKAKSHVVHLLEGRPNVRNFEVKASDTFKIGARKAA